MVKLARCMDLAVVAIGAADIANMGLVVAALSIPPVNLAQLIYLSMYTTQATIVSNYSVTVANKV